MERIVVRILSILFISLVIVGCNREENNERRALSHCADIKYINYMNSNPQLIVNKAKQREFIDKYLEWQKQDVSNLGKQSYEFLNELLKITSYTRYSKEFTEFFTKLMGILPPRN
jgi:hypothetical protein